MKVPRGGPFWRTTRKAHAVRTVDLDAKYNQKALSDSPRGNQHDCHVKEAVLEADTSRFESQLLTFLQSSLWKVTELFQTSGLLRMNGEQSYLPYQVVER